MGLRIKLRKHNNMPVLQLSGSAVGEDVRKISEKISELADGNAATVIMDIADLESVDSNGLGAFVFSWKLLDSNPPEYRFHSLDDGNVISGNPHFGGRELIARRKWCIVAPEGFKH